MVAPSPTNLRITDARQGRVEAPTVRKKAFQLTVEEAQATPNMVTGMYLLLISLCILIFDYVYVFHYRIVPREWYFFSGIV